MFHLNEKDTVDLPTTIGSTSASVIYSITKDLRKLAMLEELKMPISELKENVMNVWGCL